jgi:hypothetical protein
MSGGGTLVKGGDRGQPTGPVSDPCQEVTMATHVRSLTRIPAFLTIPFVAANASAGEVGPDRLSVAAQP